MKAEQIKQQIEALQEHFRTALLNGDFEVKEISETVIWLTITGQDFGFYFLDTNKKLMQASVSIGLMPIQLTDEQEYELGALMEPIIFKWRKDVLIARKERELEALRQEL